MMQLFLIAKLARIIIRKRIESRKYYPLLRIIYKTVHLNKEKRSSEKNPTTFGIFLAINKFIVSTLWACFRHGS